MADDPRPPDPGDYCHGPADAPFRPGLAFHRWIPASVLGMPGELVADIPRNTARVIEVCPSCQQWRPVHYARIDEPPEHQG